jgi:hypothetical protein
MIDALYTTLDRLGVDSGRDERLTMETYQHVLPDMQNDVADLLEYVLFTPPDDPEKEG